MKTAVFDIEANGLLDDVTTVWCGVVKDYETGNSYSFAPNKLHDLCRCLDSFSVLVGHNCIAYDFPVLRKVLGYEYRGRVVDTLLMSRLQRPDRTLPDGCNPRAGPHSVEAWGHRLGRAKVEHEDWSEFNSHMLLRCSEDVEIQSLIYQALLKEGEGEGWDNAIRLTCQLFRYLQMQEEYGWYVDQRHLSHSISTLDRWIHRIDRAITPRLPVLLEILETKKEGEYTYVRKPFKKDGSYSDAAIRYFTGNVSVVAGPFSRVAFRPVDLDSSQETKDYLLSLGWKPAEWNTDKQTGARTSPKLSKDDPFEGVQGSLGRLVTRRVQCKQRRGVLQGWLGEIRPDGRVAARVGGLASTGRIRHAGIVNVPSPDSGAFFAKSMRRVFAATPGYVMIGVDSKGNQQRQLIARLGMDLNDDYAKGVLYGNKKDGTDEHSIVQRRSGLPTRTMAKNVGYGTIFGAQDKRIADTAGGKTLAEAKQIREAIFRSIPGLRETIERLTAQWRATATRTWNQRYGRFEYKNGFITGLDGRPIQVESEHMVLVYQLQSDEAIQMAAAYCWFHKQMEKRGYVLHRDWGMLIWYHDEFQFEVRPEIKDEAKALAEESIAWAGRWFKIACPHEGEAKEGRNWAETH